MKKTLATLVVAMGMMGAVPSLALAHHHDRSSWGFGFNFGGCDGGWFGYNSGGCSPAPVYVDPGCDCCGHWEYRTETYIVTCGYWSQVWVGDCCCGHYDNVWVPPVYGTRTVRVWVP